MDEKCDLPALTLRFDNVLLRKDSQNFWEIVEVIKNDFSESYEKLAYWNDENDLIYCNSRHLDADIIYNFIKIEDLASNWLIR